MFLDWFQPPLYRLPAQPHAAGSPGEGWSGETRRGSPEEHLASLPLTTTQRTVAHACLAGRRLAQLVAARDGTKWLLRVGGSGVTWELEIFSLDVSVDRIGYLWAAFRPEPAPGFSRTVSEWFIQDFVVKRQNQGLGSYLLAVLHALARRDEAAKVTLTGTLSRQSGDDVARLAAFYRRRGFDVYLAEGEGSIAKVLRAAN